MEGKFEIYKAILLKWQKALNLISASTISDFDNRHIKDSIQLSGYFLNENDALIDIGSGGGFPGIPLAIKTELPTYLIESDRKKCTFLEEAIRELNLKKVRVINQRIEKTKLTETPRFPVITARALASIEKIFELLHSLLENNNITQYRLLLLKGENVSQEIIEANKDWEFDCEQIKSETNNAASILIINSFQKK